MSGDSEKRSFHGQLKKKYLKVPEDGRIETESFLDASEQSVIPLLDKMGSTAFVFVKSDVNGNISKLRKKHSENPERFKTLYAMVEDEMERKVTDAKNSATDALIWLIRGLHFICTFVHLLSKHDETEENIQPCLQEAYDNALKVHHGFLARTSIPITFKMAPNYSDLIAALSNGVGKEIIMEDINNYVEVLQENINSIHGFYVQQELKETPLGS